MQLESLLQAPTWVLLVFYSWSVLWKGLALWRAAKYSQRYWFISIIFINTFGILEITYLFFFCKKKLTTQELLFWQRKK